MIILESFLTTWPQLLPKIGIRLKPNHHVLVKVVQFPESDGQECIKDLGLNLEKSESYLFLGHLWPQASSNIWADCLMSKDVADMGRMFNEHRCGSCLKPTQHFQISDPLGTFFGSSFFLSFFHSLLLSLLWMGKGENKQERREKVNGYFLSHYYFNSFAFFFFAPPGKRFIRQN